MWVNTILLNTILADNKKLNDTVQIELSLRATAEGRLTDAHAQKAKDDVSMDWMRHRINALEKQHAILLQKAAGIAMPVPEIVPSRPGTVSSDFAHLPSFEDVGDSEAIRLGVAHDDLGFLNFREDLKARSSSE